MNSTPLIVLCSVGRLHLLKHLYQEIFIPRAVFDEVTAKPDSACQQVRDNLDWIHVERIQDTMQKRMYQAKLHDGEVEVMILAANRNWGQSRKSKLVSSQLWSCARFFSQCRKNYGNKSPLLV